MKTAGEMGIEIMYPDQFIERIAKDYIGANKLVPMPFTAYLNYRWELEQREEE